MLRKVNNHKPKLRLIRTHKKLQFQTRCLYDDMYKSAIQFLTKHNGGLFLYKKDIYELLDSHMRTSGICNPEIHLGKGYQTSMSIVGRAIKDKYIEIELDKPANNVL